MVLRGMGARYGHGLILKGVPVVQCVPGSSLVIGSNVMMISYTSDTALGVNHAVKIETLSSTARIVIGDDVGISGGSFCAQVGIEIGSHCLLGANVTIADTDFHLIEPENRRYSSDGVRAAKITIEQNVFLGAGVIVLKGVTIGRNTVVGAGSVVTRDIPMDSVAAGNPCRVLRRFSGVAPDPERQAEATPQVVSGPPQQENG
jgi:acetyltransferase-like isoleucine patch superfamily enzyme